ncbi:MAG: hypothetical protein K0S04_1150 [Herbinix sp.]|jgi:hypothetical protein|nr:hypothetical protein [Herbinix sp.]
MAVNFVARKCTCGGKLEFDLEKKIWVCMYCGTIVEREATFDRVQVDGIEGINDVVRQTLMDVAYKRVDSAERNYADCERKNHQHIGTLLANLSLLMMKISLTKDQSEVRNFLDKIIFLAKRLKEEFPVIAEDEINLYESFGNASSDIYGTLAAAYDTLKDEGRFEYISSKMNVGEIFSVDTNRNLLRIAMKRGSLDVVDQILSNQSNIDKKSALEDILESYPDVTRKREILSKLIDKDIMESDTKIFEAYFIDSKDRIETKNEVLSKTIDFGLKYNCDLILKGISSIADYDNAKVTFDALCRSELSDQETEDILGSVLSAGKRYEIALAFLQANIDNKCYIRLNANIINAFLAASTWEVEESLQIVKRLLQFDIDNRQMDAVINYYLCDNQDHNEKRSRMIPILLPERVPISISTIENYSLKTITDGNDKSKFLKMIFLTGFNKTYVSELLSKYILSSIDSKDVSAAVTDYLISEGFQVDPKILNQYIASTADDAEVKKDKIKKLIQNGTQPRNDSLDTYLLSLNNVSEYSLELFNLLSEQGCQVSEASLVKYLLKITDADKVGNLIKLLEYITFDINNTMSEIAHLGNCIFGNIFQIYVLCSEDPYDIAHGITEALTIKKVKLSGDIKVNDKSLKFKKYISENKASVSPLTLRLCEENRVFSIFG